jgi:tRNA (Thr-GGU) A37 N-methylase
MKLKIKIFPVGFVQNKFDTPLRKTEEIEKRGQKIVLFPQYAEGFYRIKEHKYLEVIFYFHKFKGYERKCKNSTLGN